MMQSSLVGNSYMSRPSRVNFRRDANLVDVTDGNELARFNRMADSDTMHHDYAAKLLLQMRRIATNEVLHSSPQTINTPNDTSVHLISPIHRPKERSIQILPVESGSLALPNCAIPSDSTVRVSALISSPSDQVSSSSPPSSLLSSSYTRFRTVSICGVNDVEPKYNNVWMKGSEISKCKVSGSVSPLHLGPSHTTSSIDKEEDSSGGFNSGFVVTPDTSRKLVFDNYGSTESIHNRYQELIQSKPNDASKQEEDGDDDYSDDESTMRDCSHDKRRTSRKVKKSDVPSTATCPSNKKKNLIMNPSTSYTHKYVGERVAPNVKVRDVLRKKFSWKSFPELEVYLINHRKQYLDCSNAMNYTKAQKNYNNELTQGLLQLAANEGYVFEDFTFAAVRDRIRCFYKSFVQATKKKKRIHHQNKQQLY